MLFEEKTKGLYFVKVNYTVSSIMVSTKEIRRRVCQLFLHVRPRQINDDMEKVAFIPVVLCYKLLLIFMRQGASSFITQVKKKIKEDNLKRKTFFTYLRLGIKL